MINLLHKKVHFVGIGGIGMSALAKLLTHNGCDITGSNLDVNDQVKILLDRNVEIHIGHDALNIKNDVEAVVCSSAVNENNVEFKRAKEMNLPVFDYHEYLGLISKQFITIAVAGTHGKSTTTAIIGKILVEAGLDPTVIIGSKVPGFDDNFRAGESEYLVVEADEFNFGMLHLEPQIIVLNNLEADHLDCYGSLDNIIKSFQKFVNKLPVDGCLFYNADDRNVAQTLGERNDFVKLGVGVANGLYKYQYSKNNILTVDGQEFEHQLWGRYNDANMAMAISLATYLKADIEKIKKAINDFTGIWRRFEVLTDDAFGMGVTVVSDYAHHPTALAGIISAAQERYKGRKVWTVFQPHHYDRVSNFFAEFVEALKLADNPVIVRTYDVPGREGDGVRKKTSKDIKNEIKNCLYLDSAEEVDSFIKETACKNDVFIAIGAGTIDQVVRNICSKK